jgi:hypothetical protein
VALRTWIFVLAGALLIGAVTLLFGLSLDPGAVACGGFVGSGDEFGCSAPRIHLLGTRLSEKEVVVWSIIAGALAGALLGLVVDRVMRRSWPSHVSTS